MTASGSARDPVSLLVAELERRGYKVGVREDRSGVHVCTKDAPLRSLRFALLDGELSRWWHIADDDWQPGERLCWAALAWQAADRVEKLLRGGQ